MSHICVIIPVHRPDLSDTEKISLDACYVQLSGFDCFLVHPKNLPITNYLSVHPHLKSCPVDPEWLSSKNAYNRMKMNPEFYSLFKDYTHFQTYELDSYIFSPNLYDFTQFDFIGAPIFKGFNNATDKSEIIKGCNSGFSLRNINSCLKVLEEFPSIQKRWTLFHLLESNLPFLRPWLKSMNWNREKVFQNDHLAAYFKGRSFHEDMIWSVVVPVLFPNFKVADTVSAYKFSFEINPGLLYKMNDYKLPLGCHAWPLSTDFWKAHIPGIL